MVDIHVACDGSPGAGWACQVTLTERGRQISTHDIRVRSPDLERLARGAADPAALVEASFAFLLEREPPHAILRSFDLLEIARYFPDYEATIRRRARAD